MMWKNDMVLYAWDVELLLEDMSIEYTRGSMTEEPRKGKSWKVRQHSRVKTFCLCAFVPFCLISHHKVL